MTGRFITFEGLDGAGKTTQVRAVAEALDGLGIDVEITREPGGTRLGERLRALLLGDEPLIPEVELLLLFAARADHVATRIRPALDRGAWVLCDRFTDASYAYQGGGRGIPAERIAILEAWVQHDLRPDLTIILDLPVEDSLARISGGLFQETRDRFEREHLEFFERVREAYLARCRRHPDRYRRIDGALDIPDVTRAILGALEAERSPEALGATCGFCLRMNANDGGTELLPWQHGTWSRIEAMLATGRPPHAMLLHGPGGIGKRRTANRLAGAILCAEPRPGPCGTCRSCHLLEAGNHPDFLRIEPGDGESAISVASIRDLVDRFTLTAERARVAVIAPAEAMNPAAANAFLKTLEEPAGRAAFILVSDAPGRLPATIRSRCGKMPMPVPPGAEALAWLETKIAPDFARHLLDLSGGAPLAALDLAHRHGEEALSALRAGMVALIGGTADPIEVAGSWRKVGDGELVLSGLFAVLGHLVRRGEADPDRLHAAVDDVVETRRQWLEVPGLNEQLLYEGLALRCAGTAA